MWSMGPFQIKDDACKSAPARLLHMHMVSTDQACRSKSVVAAFCPNVHMLYHTLFNS